jgi:PAS domain S-box-containing protein
MPPTSLGGSCAASTLAGSSGALRSTAAVVPFALDMDTGVDNASTPLAPRRRTWTGALAAALFVLVCALDLGTGFAVSLHSFFVIPVGLAAWTSGRSAGLTLAVLAAATVAYLDVESASAALSRTFIISDGISRLVAFAVVAELAVRVRGARMRAEDTAVRLQGVLDAATEVAILGWDAAGTITTYNVGAENLFGHRASETLGTTMELAIAPEELEAQSAALGREVRASDALLAKAREGATDARDWTVTRKDGERRTLRMIVTPRRASADRILGYLCVAFDVTDRHNAEKAIAAKNEELQAFAYTVSHDLKAPLRGISGYAEELERKHTAGLSERGRFCLQQIRSAAGSLEGLIDDLLRYSRLGREDVVYQDVDVEAAVRTVFGEHQATIEELGTRMEVDLQVKSTHTWELGFMQVLGNLVDNAIKYSRASSPPTVRIATRRGEHGELELSVSDNGIGFDATKYAERIFGLFDRLGQPAEYPGTGAGLAIVKRVVDKLGGVVRATSAPGAGATFVVEMPAAPAVERGRGHP